MMQARDWFGVAVRVLSLWFFIQAADRLYWVILKTDFGMGNPAVTVKDEGAWAAFYVLLGLLLLFCADPIVWVFYGLPRQHHEKAVSDANEAS